MNAPSSATVSSAPHNHDIVIIGGGAAGRLLKERVLQPMYWDLMLKGREWIANPALAE